jgi:thiol-disulfide isomerase/thioredoxin
MFAALVVVAAAAAAASAESLQPIMTRLELEVAKKPLDIVDFELPALDGARVKLSGLKGKVVFLNFWATWCGPCRLEMPTMEKLYQQLRSEGLEILAVDLQEDNATVRAFATRMALSFPILMDSSGAVGAKYGASAIPTTYLIDRNGKIFARAIGARMWDTPEMIGMFRQLLKNGPGF